PHQASRSRRASGNIRGASIDVRLLGGDGGGAQILDLGAEVADDEVVVPLLLALVDLGDPVLDGKLDAESLIYLKRDIEEGEAVDAQILLYMALRRDALQGNVAAR